VAVRRCLHLRAASSSVGRPSAFFVAAVYLFHCLLVALRPFVPIGGCSSFLYPSSSYRCCRRPGARSAPAEVERGPSAPAYSPKALQCFPLSAGPLRSVWFRDRRGGRHPTREAPTPRSARPPSVCPVASYVNSLCFAVFCSVSRSFRRPARLLTRRPRSKADACIVYVFVRSSVAYWGLRTAVAERGA
jgi:hypothetical protein